LDTQITETKGTVLIHNANEMLNFSKSEEKQLEQIFNDIAESGAKIIVTGSTVGDMALHFLNRLNLVVLKVASKFDLRRLCRATNATVLTRLGKPTAEEMGYVDVCETVEIGSDRCTVFRQEEDSSKTVTIVVRGGTMNSLDDLERAIDDGVNNVKAVVKDSRLLAGAGAFEIELATQLSSFGDKTPGLNQYSIRKYAEALEAIPRTLAENAGMDSTEVVSKLYAAHHDGNASAGVNVESDDNGSLDSQAKAIFDCLSIKKNAIRLATHAALTILSVDQIIMSKPAGGIKPKQNADWDQDD
jgi:T-complex protein 1 subunit theta